MNFDSKILTRNHKNLDLIHERLGKVAGYGEQYWLPIHQLIDKLVVVKFFENRMMNQHVRFHLSEQRVGGDDEITQRGDASDIIEVILFTISTVDR